jgi:hypothetical protein
MPARTIWIEGFFYSTPGAAKSCDVFLPQQGDEQAAAGDMMRSSDF